MREEDSNKTKLFAEEKDDMRDEVWVLSIKQEGKDMQMSFSLL